MFFLNRIDYISNIFLIRKNILKIQYIQKAYTIEKIVNYILYKAILLLRNNI